MCEHAKGNSMQVKWVANHCLATHSFGNINISMLSNLLGYHKFTLTFWCTLEYLRTHLHTETNPTNWRKNHGQPISNTNSSQIYSNEEISERNFLNQDLNARISCTLSDYSYRKRTEHSCRRERRPLDGFDSGHNASPGLLAHGNDLISGKQEAVVPSVAEFKGEGHLHAGAVVGPVAAASCCGVCWNAGPQIKLTTWLC